MFISGIQQIGIGVSNVNEAFRWYRNHFGMDVPIFEEAATAGLMLPYTGGQPQERHAILALNLQGGGGMEIWQYTQRTPEPPTFTPQLGDLGIFAAKVKCKDANACFQDLQKRGVTILSPLAERPDGRKHFFVKDPWENTFELVDSETWFAKNRPAHTGGMYGAIIGVSDMDRSLEFYAEILGYDQVLYDQSEQFADWQGIDGSPDAIGAYSLDIAKNGRALSAACLVKRKLNWYKYWTKAGLPGIFTKGAIGATWVLSTCALILPAWINCVKTVQRLATRLRWTPAAS